MRVKRRGKKNTGSVRSDYQDLIRLKKCERTFLYIRNIYCNDAAISLEKGEK